MQLRHVTEGKLVEMQSAHKVVPRCARNFINQGERATVLTHVHRARIATKNFDLFRIDALFPLKIAEFYCNLLISSILSIFVFQKIYCQQKIFF